MFKLLLFCLFCGPLSAAQAIYVSGNNAAATEIRKTMTHKPSKGCENIQLSSSPDAAGYIFDVALDPNGAANGTLSKGNNILWSDSYDSNFYHYSDRGKLNGKLLLGKFCYAIKSGKIELK
jgi:hypothetical protein